MSLGYYYESLEELEVELKLATTYLLDIFTSSSNSNLTFKLSSVKVTITYTWALLPFWLLKLYFFDFRKSFRPYIMLQQRLLVIMSLQFEFAQVLPVQFESTEVWPVQFIFVLADSIIFIPTEQKDIEWLLWNNCKNTAQRREDGVTRLISMPEFVLDLSDLTLSLRYLSWKRVLFVWRNLVVRYKSLSCTRTYRKKLLIPVIS